MSVSSAGPASEGVNEFVESRSGPRTESGAGANVTAHGRRSGAPAKGASTTLPSAGESPTGASLIDATTRTRFAFPIGIVNRGGNARNFTGAAPCAYGSNRTRTRRGRVDTLRTTISCVRSRVVPPAP